MPTVEDLLMQKGPDVIIASENDTVLTAAKMMAQANAGSVIVKDGDAPKGIFTERDLLRKVVAANKTPSQTQLGEVMTSPVKSVSLSTDLHEAREILSREHIRHLAVVEQNALVGMISFRDVLQAQAAAQTPAA
jgi:CBS domain-containing protein